MKSLASLIILFLFNGLSAQTKQSSAEFQEELNQKFANKTTSPLRETDLKSFKKLDFFPISDKYVVSAKFIRTKKEKPFAMKTTTTRLPKYKKYGELHFVIEGKSLQLNVYQNLELLKKPGYEDYLFLPFSDTTNGTETYIGGRYLDCRISSNEYWTIDFNKAYNPYCAYNYEYSCPIVPMENDLPIAIKAGVKKFHD